MPACRCSQGRAARSKRPAIAPPPSTSCFGVLPAAVASTHVSFANNPQAVATLEGIALLGDPQYQMVAQAYPFVARRVLRNDSSGAGALLRDMLYDSTGQLRPARLSALLQVCARIAVSC